MNQELYKYFLKIATVLILLVIMGDLVQACNSNQSKSNIFLIETEFESADEDITFDLSPQIQELIFDLFNVEAGPTNTPTLALTNQINFTPHGWNIPIFIDACNFRI